MYNHHIAFLFQNCGKLQVRIADSEEERTINDECKLFVGNLPVGTTSDDIYRIFNPYGKVTEVFISPSSPDGSRGLSFSAPLYLS